MVRVRWTRSALVALLLLGACAADEGSGQPQGQAATGMAVGEAWEVGVGVGEHFGPFPDIFGSNVVGALHPTGWVAAVVPTGDPLEAFRAVVADAIDRGFAAHMRTGGACWQQWSREEVPFGENGEGDGHDFGGATPFGSALPEGARVTGLSCEAVVTRSEESVGVSMGVSTEPVPAGLPVRAAVILRTRDDDPPADSYREEELDIELPAGPGDFTDHELSLAGVDVPVSDVEALFYIPPADGQGCAAAVMKSSEAPVDAASKAIAATRFAAFFQAAPQSLTTAGLDSAAAIQVIPADGPTVYIAAVAKGAESEAVVCSASS